ncbi:uncharacterized protein LOC129775476 [Toxorhynchites rutilus septentrionalis]|uniref:uncharacterized protein LOC129775476 n=1 Tax=Toxorhynchites rutilus septentrionalis TaxID=329112 RepID=UPI0024787D8F|nr:uncharacterized protein LOC129775476 [Toxorhynchites rutilus septentrionalis]
MKHPFEPKWCKYPNSFFSPVLRFLLWGRPVLTNICSNRLFHEYSHIFPALYLTVCLVIASHRFIRELLNPDRTNDSWVFPPWLRGCCQRTIRLPKHYLQLGRALFSVQALTRSLLELVTEDYEPMLGVVALAPLFLMIDVIDCVRILGGQRNGFWKCLLLQVLAMTSDVIFWSNVCCLIYHSYSNCVFNSE